MITSFSKYSQAVHPDHFHRWSWCSFRTLSLAASKSISSIDRCRIMTLTHTFIRLNLYHLHAAAQTKAHGFELQGRAHGHLKDGRIFSHGPEMDPRIGTPAYQRCQRHSAAADKAQSAVPSHSVQWFVGAQGQLCQVRLSPASWPH